MTETMERNLRNQALYAYGVREGREQGIEQNKNDIILNMFNNKFDLNVISKIVKLPIEKIKEVIKSTDNK